MYARHITEGLLAALKDTPVVVLHGARQAGKSTLVRRLAAQDHPATYLTLDRAPVLAAAKSDPAGFLDSIQGPVILDEIQRAPELILAIKVAVDDDRRPGRFLLTGSAHVLHLPRLADSLAGRMQVFTLRPLSQGEIEGRREGFIDAVFSARPMPTDQPTGRPGGSLRRDLARRILAGGYPEVLGRTDSARRRDWFDAYLSSLLMRDVQELSAIAGLAELPRLMTAVAGRAGALVNYAELGRDVGLNQVTLKRYLTLLETIFVVQTVPPWFTNRVKRVVKSPKLYLGDTGLLAHILDVTPDRFDSDPKLGGMLLENFVGLELMKQITWSRTRPSLWHFRDHRGYEVDFVLESPGGRKLVGIEVKATATLKAEDFNGLRHLAEAAGDRFHRGIILYCGADAVPFGSNLRALPVPELWR